MLANRRRDTGPELALRRALHASGLRYRVDSRPIAGLPRRADIVFGPSRVAVFVHGCFWHGCEEHYVSPRANAPFWAAKVEGNRRRDAETEGLLRAAGWLPVVVWEHEDPDRAAKRVSNIVARRKSS
jgi:DNA mismatch endonuclease (patch repair protein)